MKSGIKTSEFWVVSIVTVLIYLNQSGLLGVPMSIEQISATIAPAMTYVLSRGIAKTGKK